MKYQLVLQFPYRKIDDFDAMIRLEDELCHILRYVANVDGHDCGSGEMNIFILTNEPQEVFDRAKIVVENLRLFSELSAAHRSINGEEYTRLWPINETQPFLVI